MENFPKSQSQKVQRSLRVSKVYGGLVYKKNITLYRIKKLYFNEKRRELGDKGNECINNI
jgi:ribosomal protein L15E